MWSGNNPRCTIGFNRLIRDPNATRLKKAEQSIIVQKNALTSYWEDEEASFGSQTPKHFADLPESLRNVRHAMTYMLLTRDTLKIIFQYIVHRFNDPTAPKLPADRLAGTVDTDSRSDSDVDVAESELDNICPFFILQSCWDRIL